MATASPFFGTSERLRARPVERSELQLDDLVEEHVPWGAKLPFAGVEKKQKQADFLKEETRDKKWWCIGIFDVILLISWDLMVVTAG